ncbi:type I-E CRISPR-associated protein Cse2/CasB [Phytoactinopolyspora mesophila]|uniref:Type I-E CRISPR-associated protein Cse2/CasB n=1 Tax=Phytoactinopolyspora mesophila TaxID=2650750 RepID=A0A7K3M018_9ACTN|nr:type I-E CRISPR-associated protein Cse2/CasB [Phytoactinopolyspora mesophila]NDL56609.1 type I-E CRISPR-associated protein Cse2/CasB [Phytoactinopolyspora mesophila]
MTTDTAATDVVEPERRSRPLRDLGFALDRKITRLQKEYLGGRSAARASLARLRRGLGKPAGSVPDIWETTIGTVPSELSWDRDRPSPAEEAAHAALTLYALHQQSQSWPAHVPGVSFGQAVRRLATRAETSEEAVTRRFMAVATAQTIDEILVHVRGLVTQLKSAHIGLDYARFADDIHGLLRPSWQRSIRLAWGRDFYRVAASIDATDDTDDADASDDGATTTNSDDQ